MPITQARIIELLTEYETVCRERDQLRSQLIQTIQHVTERLIEPQAALSFIATYLSLNPPTQPVALRIESRHFALNAGRNIRRAEREKRRRAATGSPKALTAPRSLVRELSLEDLTESDMEAYLKWQGASRGGSSDGN